MKRVAFTFAVMLAASLAIAFAQQPARDQTAAPGSAPTGTARIVGVVVTSDPQATPARRTIVTLTGAELGPGRTAVSDDSGQFMFDRLPPGRFTLSGTKPGYLPAAYGSVKPGRPGVPLQVASGQQLNNIRLTIARAAAISGILRDLNGEPIDGLQVHAFRVPAPGAAPILQLAASASTDDRGVYRVFGLAPGSYVIASGIRVGGLGNFDLEVMSASQIDDAIRALQRQTGRPVSGPPPARQPTATGFFAYAPVYFPNTSSASAASSITVALGEERTNVDLSVNLTRMVAIQGTVTSPDGTVPALQFVINTAGLQLPPLVGGAPVFSSQATISGRSFKYTNVAPGHYRIAVQATSPSVMFATAEVDVSGDDISGLSLVLQPALKMSGRVIFDGATLKAPEPAAVRVTLLPTNGLGSSAMGTTRMGNFLVPPANIQPDGSFEITGILPETYRFTTTAPAGWWLRSAVIGGRDRLDYPMEIAGPSDISGAVLTFSDRHSVLSGRLENPAGQAAAAYFVAVFPADRALWRPQSRRIRLARADADGTWIVKDLPPGDYHIAVLTDIDTVDALDAALLENITGSAVKITLADGEQKTQNLRVGR